LARAVEVWPLDRVRELDRTSTIVWASPSIAPIVRDALPFEAWSVGQPLPERARTLVAVGGGNLLDEAKRFVHDNAPHLCLIAIPSIWGSGAEASPVVVLNRGADKEIRMDELYLPYARAIWPELAATIPTARARDACGDAWAHALEGFLSPIASLDVRAAAAEIMRDMLDAGVGNDARWFELSARAAAAQARSSVGLIHGIAHTLEPAMNAREWGHARLCATYVRPVFAYNRRVEKVAALLRDHDLSTEAITGAANALFDEDHYRQSLPVLQAEWRSVLRDRCTRTNAVLVRQTDLQFFLDFA
jgi:alcohol dehydrogenase class IV